MSLSLTLDRSIFHGENFNRLVDSPLRKACRAGRISIYITPILIEETLNLLLKPEKKLDLKNQLKFILDVSKGRWFNETIEIWSGELEGKSRKDYLFMTRSEEKHRRKNLLDLAEGKDGHEKGFRDVVEKKNIHRRMAAGMRKALVEMRQSVAQNKTKPKGKTPSSSTFERYYEANWYQFGSDLIRKHVTTSEDIEEIIRIWSGNKLRYPYFTHWTRAMLYTTYYAMTNLNAPLDKNTQMDLSL